MYFINYNRLTKVVLIENFVLIDITLCESVTLVYSQVVAGAHKAPGRSEYWYTENLLSHVSFLYIFSNYK